jgi:hypothetical protein
MTSTEVLNGFDCSNGLGSTNNLLMDSQAQKNRLLAGFLAHVYL